MAKQSSKYVFGLEDKNISKLARIQKLIDDVQDGKNNNDNEYYQTCSYKQPDHLLFLHSDDIIRLLEKNGRLLNKSAILF